MQVTESFFVCVFSRQPFAKVLKSYDLPQEVALLLGAADQVGLKPRGLECSEQIVLFKVDLCGVRAGSNFTFRNALA